MTNRSFILGVGAALFLAAAGAARAEEVHTVETAERAHAGPGPLAELAKEVERALPQAGSLPSDLARYFDDEPLPGAGRGGLRIAIVPVEFSDAPHDPRFKLEDWEKLLFSRGAYTAKSPTGEPVFGSVADYYDENSCGKFKIEGRAFDWVRAPRPKAFYDKLPIYAAPLFFFRAALGRIEAREGKDALAKFDAVCFVCAGERGTPRQLLWPHSSGVPWRGKILRYYLASETEAKRFCAIGVHCHELGHVLGILDKYGSGPHDGVGVWCNMAVGDQGDRENRDRRPLHFCAWCKTKLGWLEPATVDPGTTQTIRLRAVERSGREAVKVLVDPEGSEYFLLENRRRKGFDAGGPRGGLLIWHVGEPGASLRNGVWPYNIDLEPAHGKRRFGAHKDLDRVAWPLAGQTDFTPFSSPDSNSWNPRARERGSSPATTAAA